MGGINKKISIMYLVLSIIGCVITYANCPIIWVSRPQTEMPLITMEAEYIALLQSTRDVLPFASLMKEIEFGIELQGDTPEVLCSIFEKTVTVNKDNQRLVALVVSLQMRPLYKAHCNQVSALPEFHFEC